MITVVLHVIVKERSKRYCTSRTHLADETIQRPLETIECNDGTAFGICLGVRDPVLRGLWSMNETLRLSPNLVRPLWHNPVHVLSLPAVCGAQSRIVHLVNSPAFPAGPYLTFPSSA